MNNGWHDREAAEFIETHVAAGASVDLAARIYTSRLLGRDRHLVMHGGGNTSVKVQSKDIFGQPLAVLHVKGSGYDLDTITAPGLPGVKLAPLLQLRELAELSDEEMVNQLRSALLDSQSPNPSVETLLHAFIPAKYIDHSHASPILSLVNQEDGHALCRRIFGDRVAIVPYIMPGFALAKAAADAYDQAPQCEGMILLNHGLFTFGETAKQAYERMINLCQDAEKAIGPVTAATGDDQAVAVAPAIGQRVLNQLRGVLQTAADGTTKQWVCDLRHEPADLAWSLHPELPRWSQRGVATPDHILRTKFKPLLLQHPDAYTDAAAYKVHITEAVAAFQEDYRAYFATHNANAVTPKVRLDANPRVALVPGLGIIGIGADHKAAAIAADLACQTRDVVLAAEQVGRFVSISEADAFAMEYWSLEQAKLGKKAPPPLAGKVVAVTGAAGAIGRAIAEAYAAQGAEIAALDVAPAGCAALAEAKPSWLVIPTDCTDADAVADAFTAISYRYGGVDIVIANCGGAKGGAVGDLPLATLNEQFSLNLFAHQTVCQAALQVFRNQGYGGQIFFNISKQAVNPGRDFGAYGLPKAALMALMKQYALDHSHEGIRVGGVNADRIRSGLLTADMIKERSEKRQLSEAAYMAGNLLGREVKATDVAGAFVYLAQAEASQACVITVDGGNIAASLR